MLESATVRYPQSGVDPAERERTKARRAAEVILREHPGALVFAQTGDGSIVELPASLGLDGWPVLATDGARTALDLCVAEDRMTMVNAWIQLKQDAVAEATARLRTDPEQWWVVRMLDLRHTHGVILTIGWPTAEGGRPEGERDEATGPVSTTPRFCSRKQDDEGNVIDCDVAYLEMFGYRREEVVGNPTFERVHPDDQARVIEAWIAVVATARTQMFRVRMRRGDGRWLWVDTTLHSYLEDAAQPHILAECIDVSAEMAAQEALEDREELLRRLIEEMPDGLLQVDREGNVVFHNARLSDILNAPAAENVDLDCLLASLTAGSKDAFRQALSHVIDEGAPLDVEGAITGPHGESRYMLFKTRPLLRDGVATGAIVSVLDVTDSAQARHELEERANRDPLTGARNRAAILAALIAELEGPTKTAVLYIDLDRFKSINDTLGHAAGDDVLVEVTRRLKGAMRPNDELGRLGGDEFLVLLRDVASRDAAMGAAERISDAVRGSCRLVCGSVELCASVGVAVSAASDVGAQRLIEQADAAMYRSKEQRRGIPVLASVTAFSC
jgi:diguanylate cyclase (GGDEF)-like protein/PAS domain S-box-containing protein